MPMIGQCSGRSRKESRASIVASSRAVSASETPRPGVGSVGSFDAAASAAGDVAPTISRRTVPARRTRSMRSSCGPSVESACTVRKLRPRMASGSSGTSGMRIELRKMLRVAGASTARSRTARTTAGASATSNVRFAPQISGARTRSISSAVTMPTTPPAPRRAHSRSGSDSSSTRSCVPSVRSTQAARRLSEPSPAVRLNQE